MAWKSKKTPVKSAKGGKKIRKSPKDPQITARRRRWFIFLSILLSAGILIAGFWAMETVALRNQGHQGAAVVGVRIIDRPQWMPDSLARKIAADILPEGLDYYDDTLSEQVYKLAVAHPWISHVESVLKKRMTDGEKAYIELRARFRQPIAKAGAHGRYSFIDVDGAHLPDSADSPQVPRYVLAASLGDSEATGKEIYYADQALLPANGVLKKIHYIIVDGVAAPAPGAGKPWAGEDLADGLKLVKLLLARPYADQITVVDVTNHGGRVSKSSSEITFHAQVGRSRATEIRFGRFPTTGDWVVGPAEKLANLDEYVRSNKGQLAGVNEYLDLRYDEMHVSIN